MSFTLDSNLTFDDHVRIAEIDKEYFSEEYLTDPEITWAYYCRNNDTIICIRDTDNEKIAAYLSLIPIRDEVFKSIVSGDLIESQISADDVLSYDAPGNHKLLLSAIAVASEYKKINFVTVFYRELKRKITELEHRGIIFTDVIADCVFEEGALLCERLLDMKFIHLTPRNTKIYWGAGLFKKR